MFAFCVGLLLGVLATLWASRSTRALTGLATLGAGLIRLGEALIQRTGRG